MNMKAAYRYQVTDNIKAILTYYITLNVVYLLAISGVAVVVSYNNGTPVSGQFSGFEMSSIIFLFITGLCYFKDTFGMLLQNGISRKTLFIAHCHSPCSWRLLISFYLSFIS